MQDVLDLLLAHGANLEARDYIGQTPLLSTWVVGHSIQRSNVLALQALMSAGADVCAVSDISPDSSIHHCFRYHREIDFIQLLLDSGADVNSRGSHGSTPLHLALSSNSGAKYQLSPV